MKKIKVLLLAVALFLTGCNCTIRKTPSEFDRAVEKVAKLQEQVILEIEKEKEKENE